MVRVVADTGPLNYLLLIGEIDVLPACFQTISIPEAVRAELLHSNSPPDVRKWASLPPHWLAVEPNSTAVNAELGSLGAGERAAIELAIEHRARLILMDDRAGVAAARGKRLAVAGTLGVLDLGARRGLLDLRSALERLKATSFRHGPNLIEALLARHERERKPRP